MRLTLLLLGLLTVLPVLAESPALSSASALLSPSTHLAGKFEQDKSLPFLSSPLHSSGDFSLAPLKGLRWQVTAPIASLMVVNDQGVSLDGQRSNDRGVGQLMRQLLQAFGSGELAGLERVFSVDGDVSGGHWTLRLTPKPTGLRRALDAIHVEGGAQLQSIRIMEKSGGQTHIRLYDLVTEPPGFPDDVNKH